MKFGVRKRSFKKSFKAKTAGKLNRRVKKATTPFYGKKGAGLLKAPKKAIYNKIYNSTTIDRRKLYSLPNGKKGASGKRNLSLPKDHTSNKAEWTPESIYVAFLLGFIFFSFFFPALWFIVACMIATKIVLWYKKKHPKD